MNRTPTSAFSTRFERALRWSAFQHRKQTRKTTATPYIQHPYGVALLLDRAGLVEDVVIAGLLHDVVEDTDATIDDVSNRFGPLVAVLVAWCTERKLDETGRKRPWTERKLDHRAAIAEAPWEARAIVLADKLHNLISIRTDLEDGVDVWSRFGADRADVLANQRAMIAACRSSSEPAIRRLADMASEQLATVEEFAADQSESGPTRAG